MKATSPEKRENIRKLYADGMSANQIAKILRMHSNTILRIVGDIKRPNDQALKSSLCGKKRFLGALRVSDEFLEI